MTRVKICGITSLKDAWTAIDSGADALGFVFYAKSPRRATAGEARAIIRTLPPMVITVGVFVDETPRVIKDVVEYCGLGMVQLHGGEALQSNEGSNVPVIRAIRLHTASDLKMISEYRAPLYLLDAYDRDKQGGTGKRIPLKLLSKVPSGTRFLLAGGLNPSNVAAVVRKVRPFGVDVSSGVEREPGVKDLSKLRRFIRSAKNA